MRTSPNRRAAAVALPARKPMALARRVSLFEREIRVKLSAVAADLLFELATVLSEGQVEAGRYYGSTMITIDVTAAAGAVSDACDAATARRLGELCRADESVATHARAIAVAEAEARAGARLGAVQVDLRTHATGTHLHIDVDVEAALAAARRP